MAGHLSELGQHPPAPPPPPGVPAFPSHPHLLDPQLQLPQQLSPAYASHHHQLIMAQQRPVSPPSPFAFAPPPIGDGRGSSSSGSGAHLQQLGSLHHQLPPSAPTNPGDAAEGYDGSRSPALSDGGEDNDDVHGDDIGFHPQAGYHASLAPPLDHGRSPSDGNDLNHSGGRPRADSDASSGSSSRDGQGSPSTSRSGPSTGEGQGDPSGAGGEGAGSRLIASGSKPSGGRKPRPPRTSTTQARPQVKVAPGPKENLTSIAAIRSYPTGEDDERPFQCDLCPQNFNRNHDLKRHRKIHMELKPFSCTKCNKHFSRKDALRRHWLVKGCKGGEVAGAGIPSDPAFYETRPSTSAAAAAAALSASSKSSSLPPTTVADDAATSHVPPKPKRTSSSRVISGSGAGGTVSAASSTGSKKHGGGGGKSKGGPRKSKSLGGRERPTHRDEDDGSGLEAELDEDPDTSGAGPSSYSGSSTGPFKLPLPQSFAGSGHSLSPPHLQSLQIPNSTSSSGGLSPHFQRQQQGLRDVSPSGLPAFAPSPSGNGQYGGGLNLYLQQQHQQPQQQHLHQQQHPAQYQQFQLPYPSHLTANDVGPYAQSPTEPHSALSSDGPSHPALLNGGSTPGPYGVASFSGSMDYPRAGFFPQGPVLGLHQQVAQRQTYRTPDDIDAWRLSGGNMRYPHDPANGNGGSEGGGGFHSASSSFGASLVAPATDGSTALPLGSNQPSLLYTPYQDQLSQSGPQQQQQHQPQTSTSALHLSPGGGRPGSPSQLHPHQQQMQHVLVNHHTLESSGFYPNLLQQQQMHQQQHQHHQHQQQRWFQAGGSNGLSLPQQAPGSGQNSPSFDHDQARF